MSGSKKQFSKYSKQIKVDPNAINGVTIQGNTPSNEEKVEKRSVKNLKLYVGVSVALVGVVGLVSCAGCSGPAKTTSVVDDNSDKQNSDTSSDLNGFVQSSSEDLTKPVDSNPENSESLVVSLPADAEVVGTIDFEPAFVKVTAEDVVKLSKSYAEYVNKTADFSAIWNQHAELKPQDLYSIVYLSNIDYISKEETAKLIAMGAISDNITQITSDSEGFLALYQSDTINKIIDGKDNIIDISLLFVNEEGKEIAEVMNKATLDFITESKEVTYKNYLDTVCYYAKGVTLPFSYDYSESIYKNDISRLPVGATYTLWRTASNIDFISRFKGIAKESYSQLMYKREVMKDGTIEYGFDNARIDNLFNDCKLPEELKVPDKTLQK